MSTRYDLVSPRKAKDGDRVYFTKIGAAFPNRSGEGYTLVFEALPLPDAEGQVRVLMMVPKEKEDREPAQRKASPARDDSDEIPF